MKVLQVIDSLSPAGAEVFVCQLSQALREAGIDCHLYALKSTGSWLEQECFRNGIPLHFSSTENVYSPQQVLNLQRHLSAYQYDVVHVHLFPAQLWVALAAALCSHPPALVTTEHSTNNRRRNSPFRFADKWMYARYQSLLTVSDASTTALQNWVPPLAHRVATMKNGVRLKAIAQTERVDLKTQLGINGNLLGISVGRCVDVKNHPCSIRAIAKVPGVHLAIVGDGVLLPQLKALAESLQVAGRIHFLGHKKEVIPLLKGADFYLQASRFEGFSIAALEALAAGLPTLTSRVPGLTDVVADAGLTFESDNDAQLASKIALFDAEPGLRSALAAKSRLRAREFDLSKTAQDHISVYSSLLAASSAAESLRILSVVTRFGAGGPPISVIQQARGLQKYGYETIIATGSCAAQDADMSYILTPQDQVEWVPSMSRNVAPGADLIALFRLIQLIRKYKPDIVHTHTAKAGVLGRLAAFIAGAPVVVHTFHGNVLRGYFGPFASRCIQLVEQVFARMSDLLLVLSDQQFREISVEFKIGDSRKVRVLPIGLPLQEFAALTPPPAHKDQLVVAWFGRLVEVKNVPLLIEVVQKALEALPNVYFLIAGDGSERPAIQALADNSNGRVEFLGWQKDITPIIARADLLLQTSFNEGTPIALIQGMAAARPFISTAVGGLPDMVIGEEKVHCGSRWFHNGVLTPLDAAAFVSTLQVFAQNRFLLSQMGSDGRDWALTQYSETKMLEATHQIYTELLSAKGLRTSVPEIDMSKQLANLAAQTKAHAAAEIEIPSAPAAQTKPTPSPKSRIPSEP